MVDNAPADWMYVDIILQAVWDCKLSIFLAPICLLVKH